MPRADGQQEVGKAGWERGGLVVRWLLPPQGGCGAVSVVAGRVSGAQARAHGGKREILSQLCLELEGRKLGGSMECLMF